MGQHSITEKNQDKEIQRRIMAGWAAYAKYRDGFRSNLAICLKRQMYNSCVLPAMTLWCRDLDTDQTSKQQTCVRTDQNGKKYAQHHIQGQKDQHLGQEEDNQQCEKNEMVKGIAHQPPQRRLTDVACRHVETIQMPRKNEKGDQPSDGEATWTTTAWSHTI